MIKEDYVSFEVAKLLKEKGFDGDINAYYHIWDNGNKVCSAQEFSCSEAPHLYILAPTHQMAMKWLREKHKILITIIPQEIGLGVDKLCYGIYKITEDLYQPLCNGKTDSLVNSYEEAVEAAIKYCLEHLI